jgi:hypothetical protein
MYCSSVRTSTGGPINVDAPDPDEVLEDLLLDFTRLVGGVITFIVDPRSSAGVLKVLLHGVQRFAGVPEKKDQERKQVLCYKGDVTGVDMVTVAFDEEQLDYVSAVNVPQTIDRAIQLLQEEPTHHTIGPLRVGDATQTYAPSPPQEPACTYCLGT